VLERERYGEIANDLLDWIDPTGSRRPDTKASIFFVVSLVFGSPISSHPEDVEGHAATIVGSALNNHAEKPVIGSMVASAPLSSVPAGGHAPEPDGSCGRQTDCRRTRSAISVPWRSVTAPSADTAKPGSVPDNLKLPAVRPQVPKMRLLGEA
jgi:hypothetical protein